MNSKSQHFKWPNKSLPSTVPHIKREFPKKSSGSRSEEISLNKHGNFWCHLAHGSYYSPTYPARKSCCLLPASNGTGTDSNWLFLAKRNVRQRGLAPWGLLNRGVRGAVLPSYLLILLQSYHLVSRQSSSAPAKALSKAFPCGFLFLGLGTNKLSSVLLSPQGDFSSNAV